MVPTAIHPGEHLAEELKELGMSAAELARKLDVPTNRVTGILNGQRAITGDTALRLAHFFGTSAEFWLNLQGLYELRLAEKGERLHRGGLSFWHDVARRRVNVGQAGIGERHAGVGGPVAGVLLNRLLEISYAVS